ncbi:MAG: aspartate/glutamate racemase family protein [Lysobacterales bacterium]
MNKTTTIGVLGTGDSPEPTTTVPEPIARGARDSKPVLCDLEGAVFPIDKAASEVCASAYVNAGLKAQQVGHGGAYINTMGDYGLRALRRVATIPVSGAGEGSIHTARKQGLQFAIVTIWPPSMRFIYDAMLEACQAEDECKALYHLSEDGDLASLDQPDNFVEQMRGCSLTSLAQIREACERALNDDGADVVILGCTCMAPTAALLTGDGLPIIEPMAAGYRYLEDLIKTGAD